MRFLKISKTKTEKKKEISTTILLSNVDRFDKVVLFCGFRDKFFSKKLLFFFQNFNNFFPLRIMS